MELKEAVYAAIREKTGTEDPYGWSVKNDICYDIALRAAEIAVGTGKAGANHDWLRPGLSRLMDRINRAVSSDYSAGIRLTSPVASSNCT